MTQPLTEQEKKECAELIIVKEEAIANKQALAEKVEQLTNSIAA